MSFSYVPSVNGMPELKYTKRAWRFRLHHRDEGSFVSTMGRFKAQLELKRSRACLFGKFLPGETAANALAAALAHGDHAALASGPTLMREYGRLRLCARL